MAKGATDEELKYCLTVARRYKLDPFKQQIWFIRRWDKNADNGHGGEGAYIWVPQVGIYGLLHIAARDHKDYAGMSQVEYGPKITIQIDGHNISGPEWARVNVWKKGSPHPTVGEAYFEEYCPKKWENTLFWRTMPRRMIGKCAKAQGAREACPDLGGLKIPEEMDRMNEQFSQDVTAGGRQIVDEKGFAPSGQPVTHDARRQVAAQAGTDPTIEKLKAQGLWCERHNGHVARCPSDEHTPADHKVMEEAERKAANERAQKPAATPEASKPAIEVKPGPEKLYRGRVEWDWADGEAPVLRGDLDTVLVDLQQRCSMVWGKDEFWHVKPADLGTVKSVCEFYDLKLEVIEQKSKSSKSSGSRRPDQQTTGAAGRPATGERSQPATPTVVTGVVVRVEEKMTTGKPPTDGSKGRPSVPYMTVLFKRDHGGDTWMATFDKALFPWLERAAKHSGVDCELTVKPNPKYGPNIIGIRRIGTLRFDEDGKAPIVERDREPGSPTLFK